MYVLHQRDRGSNGGDMLEVERIVAQQDCRQAPVGAREREKG